MVLYKDASPTPAARQAHAGDTGPDAAAGGPQADTQPSVLQYLVNFGPLLAEFLGTTLVTFCYCCGREGSPAAWRPTSTGFSIMACTYALGPISGAHLNPAVSLCTGLAGKGRWSRLFQYMLFQILGAILGAAMARQAYGHRLRRAIGPQGDYGEGNALFMECIFTGMLCFVYLNVALSRDNNPISDGNQFYALAVAFMYIAGGHTSWDISGGFFNPAVALGTDTANRMFNSESNHFGFSIGYSFIEFIGAWIGAVAFRTLRPSEDFPAEAFGRYKPSRAVQLLSEAVGTFSLVFIAENAANSTSTPKAMPWAAAATEVSMVYALSDVSGAHFNPVVTVAVAFSGRAGRNAFSWIEMVEYIVVQVLAGNVGAWISTAVCNGKNLPLWPNQEEFGIETPSVAELIFSFVLAYITLATSTVTGINTPSMRNSYFGIAMGLTIAAGGLSLSRLSRGLMNPALTIGISTVHMVNHGSFWPCLIVSVHQVCGAWLAAVFFRVSHAATYQKEGVHLLAGIRRSPGLV